MRKIILPTLFILALSFGVFAQSSDVTFEQFKITDVGSISIPSIMELQSGTYKEFSESLSKDLMKKQGIEITGDGIIFQQKGLNDFKKVNTYARVIIETTVGKQGNYGKITSKPTLTKQEIQYASAILKKQLEDELKGIGLKIVKWNGVSVDNVNSRSVMKVAYLRQLNNNPPVYVEILFFENNDRLHKLTISYRQQDASIWEESLRKTKNSFTVTNVK